MRTLLLVGKRTTRMSVSLSDSVKTALHGMQLTASSNICVDIGRHHEIARSFAVQFGE